MSRILLFPAVLGVVLLALHLRVASGVGSSPASGGGNVEAAATSTTPVPGKVRQVSRSVVLSRARTRLARVQALPDGDRRRNGLQQVAGATARQTALNGQDPELVIGLLTVEAKAHMALGDMAAARLAIQRTHEVYGQNLPESSFSEWLDTQVGRLRNTRYYDLAAMHLESAPGDGETPVALARRSMLIGDILLQKAYPDGPYDEVIARYESTAIRYASSAPEIAESSALRQAKTLWRAERIDEARQLFAQLAETASEPIAEQARHYPELMQAVRALKNTETTGGPDENESRQ